MTTRGSRSGWLALATVLALPLIELGRYLLNPTMPVLYGDQALIALGAYKAAHLQQVLGPYSHNGFHHLGPMLFYLLSPFAGNIYLGAIVINALMLGGIVAVVWWRWGQERALQIAIVTNVVVLFTGTSLFREPWNPYLIVAATMLFAVSVVARADLIAVLVGSFIIQSEMAAGPFVIGALVVTFGFVRPRLSWKWLAVVVIWIPTFVQWHNLGDIFTSNTITPLQHAFSVALNAITVVPLGNRMYVSHLHHTLAALLIGTLLLVIGALYAFLRGSIEAHRFVVLALLASLLGAIAFTHNKGEPNPYYAVWLAVVPFCVLSALMFCKIRASSTVIALVALAFVAQSAFAARPVNATVGSGPWPTNTARDQTKPITTRLTNEALAAVAPGTKHVAIDIQRESDWPYVAGVVWALHNKGIDSTVTPQKWDLYFGDSEANADLKLSVETDGLQNPVIRINR